MKRFSWLRFVGHLFGRSRIKHRVRVRQRSLQTANRIEGLEQRWLLSRDPLTDFVSSQEIAPGAVIERTALDYDLSAGSTDSLRPSGPVFGGHQLNGNGLEFHFNPAPGMPQFAIDGFQAAADLWSSIFFDDIVVNIDIDFAPLSPGVIGQTGSSQVQFGYSTFRSTLTADATSSSDAIAVANLQSASALGMLINFTSDNPNGNGSPTPYFDNNGSANNTTINLTTANAKAAGLIAADAAASDAQMEFSSTFAFDFDRSDGISPGTFDFIGVAAHEIGHALGFISGVDSLDFFSAVLGAQPADFFIGSNAVTPLDLFRYSPQSVSNGPGVFDWTVGTNSYFSIDGGATSLNATFSSGSFLGDGNQASHWEDNLGIGIMDPTSDFGEFLQITDFDKQGFDVIGWDLDSGFGFDVTQSDNVTRVVEGDATDSFTLTPKTPLAGSVELTLTANSQVEISTNGVNFSNSAVLTFSGQTSQTITVRAIDDTLAEGNHTGSISLDITASSDPDYPTSLPVPSVTVQIDDNELASFERVEPLGSFIGSSDDNLGHLLSAGASRDYTFFAEAGQTFAAEADPTLSAVLTVQLLGVSQAFSSSAPGSTAVLPPQVITADGYYTVRVTGSAVTDFNLTGYRNAALESKLGDTSNGNELGLDSSLIPLFAGRVAVLGSSVLSGGSPLFFNNSSDPGAFIDISGTGNPLILADDAEATITTTVGNSLFPAGLVTVGNNGGITAGVGDVGVTNQTLPTSGMGTALLPYWDDLGTGSGITDTVFWEERLVNGIPTLIVQWSNIPHYNGIGAATFQLQLFAAGPIYARYSYADVDFDGTSLGFGGSATIGYQASPASAVQFSFDSLSVNAGTVLDLTRIDFPTDVDEYILDLTGKVGQSIDVVLTGRSGADFSHELLQLLAADGTTVLATAVADPVQPGVSATNFDLAITGFIVPANGPYTIRLTSTVAGDYSIVATEAATFEVENNNSPPSDPLRDISGPQNVLGYLDTTSGSVVFAADFNDGSSPSLDGFVIDNSPLGLWHQSVGRSTTPGHSSPYSLYFGVGEGPNGGGNFDQGTVAGRVTSPPIDLTDVTSAQLSFNYLLQTEQLFPFDRASVQISVNGGAFVSLIDRLADTSSTFRSSTIDLTSFVGNSVQIRFEFDSGDATDNFLEGWYVDDVVVTATGLPDVYAIVADAGELVIVATATPFDDALNSPLNNLNPALQIIHPDGITIVASDLDSSADGKNASLTFIAPVSGTYQVRVIPTSGSGEYLLHAGVDATPPAIVDLSPADDSINVPVTADLLLTFNKGIVKGNGNILLKNSATDATVQTINVNSAAVSIVGNQVAVDLATLASATGYYVVIPSTAFTDQNGNPFGGFSSPTAWNFTTADVLPPAITTLSPPDDATNVNITTDLMLTFSENVIKGAGTILIKKSSDGSTAQTIDVNSASVVVAGNVVTVDLANLLSSTGYFVQISAGAFADASGNAFAGISSSTGWNFSTGDFDPPLIVTLSPADNAVDVAVNSDLQLTFNESVVKGTGNILIRRSSDNSTAQTINVTSPLVTVAANIVTIDLALLTTTTGYYVEVPSTAFLDAANNPFAGFTGSTAWNFVTSNNLVPVITTAATVSVAENTSTAAVILNVDATNPDVPVQTLTFTLSGVDAARFNINPATGEIRFAAVPDFEIPADVGLNNVYNVTVTVTDNGTPNLSASQDLTITVTAENDNSPLISTGNTASVLENTSTAVVVLDVNATDADVPAQGLTYSLSGADATKFTIDSATGQIKFVTSPNFEAPADLGANNIYDITVTVTDNGSPVRSTSQNVTISVTNVNDNTPVIGSAATASVAENTLTSTVVLDVNATDADLPPQALSYTLSGTDAAAFTINNFTGEIRFVSSPDFEVPTDQDADHVYQVTVTVSDNGSPALTATQSLTITVTAVNDNAPQISSAATGSIPENSAGNVVVLDVNATDADQPGQSLTYGLTGPGAAFLNIDPATGEITFAINLDYENPADSNGDNVYEVTVVVTDNGTPSQSTSQSLSLTVTPVNDNTPVINSGASATVPENTPTSTVLLDVNATDADRPASSLTYSLSGPDAALLAIDSATGQIRFVTSPDFEAPVDQGANHTYEVAVTVSDNDGVSRTTSQALTINVTPLNDNAPIINSGATATIAERSPTSTVLIDVDATDADQPGQALTYTLGGPDAALFSLNSATGVLTFVSSPNFEAPADQGGNNVYNVTVTVADNGNPSQSVSQNLTVSVTNVNEAPTDFDISGTTVVENRPTGTLIGNFSSTDVDAGDTFTYSLVVGPGSTDNTLFTIVGGELRTAATFNFEAQSSYSIRVRTADAGGLIFEKPLTITILDANDTPTDVALSGNVVAENQPVGTPIGSLTSTDQDVADTFTYTLVSGAGDADNSSFTIVGDQIQTTASFNFEAKSGYTLRVRSTDSGGATVEKAFTVTVVNVNEQPTDVALTKSTVAENLAAATSVGSFISTDQDAGGSFSYELVSGAGSEDNASFTVFGSQLLTAETFNFESRSSYSIRVRTTDQGGLSTEKALTITVLNVNEQPTAIDLSAVSIPETQPVGFTVGTFSTTDFDLNDTFNYTLVLGTGSNDNAKFEIVGDQLRTTSTFDFETRSIYSIRVRSRDSGGLFLFAIFTINVTNSNEAPIDVTLTPSVIAENQPANTTVGTFNTTDGDTSDTFTYALVGGPGSTNNAAFTIAGGQLRAIAPLNFEAQSGYAVRVRSTDSAGLSIEKALTINVTNANEAPTDIALSSTSVAENLAAGTLVGNLSSTDPDLNETFTYSLVAGTGSADNSSFTIANGQLRTAASFDSEAKSNYSIRIRSTDASGLFFEEAFTINVTSVNEIPQEMTLAPTSVAENLPAGTVVGSLTTTDPDAGSTFTYAFVPGVGSVDNASFTIDGSQIKTTAALNFEAKQTYSIRIRGTDAGGLSIERVYSITVGNVNEAPATLSLSNATIAENLAANTEIGTFDSTDPDAGEVFTYSLVPGAGSSGNAAFVIMGDRLIAADSFDFEAQGTYSIRVRSTDAGGLSTEDVLTINVTNRVDPPVIELTPGGVTLPNGKGGLVDVGSTVTDQDSTNFQGNRLVIAVDTQGQQSSDRLRMLQIGKGAERLKATKTQLKLGKTVIGTVAGGRSGQPLTITFTQNVNVDLVQQVLRQISFKSHGEPGATRHIQYQMFDATGNTSGPVTKEVTME